MSEIRILGAGDKETSNKTQRLKHSKLYYEISTYIQKKKLKNWMKNKKEIKTMISMRAILNKSCTFQY